MKNGNKKGEREPRLELPILLCLRRELKDRYDVTIWHAAGGCRVRADSQAG
jgi:uncharacterized protein (UPF0261 family)